MVFERTSVGLDVYAVLTRCRIDRLSHIDRRTGERVRRYQHDTPGALIDVGVKKIGNIPDGGDVPYRIGRADRSDRVPPSVPATD